MEFGIPPHDIETTDTAQLLGLVAAKQAATVDARIALCGEQPNPLTPSLRGKGEPNKTPRKAAPPLTPSP